jgi:hypothetical protein
VRIRSARDGVVAGFSIVAPEVAQTDASSPITIMLCCVISLRSEWQVIVNGDLVAGQIDQRGSKRRITAIQQAEMFIAYNYYFLGGFVACTGRAQADAERGESCRDAARLPSLQ